MANHWFKGSGLGATVETGPNWSEKSVVDGKLITGQNPQSTPKMVVKELIEKLGS